MSRRRRSLAGAYPSEAEINMTPMIDIVFQLLIFFVLTAKFIQFEGELLSYLPKDRGIEQTNDQPPVNPVIIFLLWKGEEGDDGECIAITTQYQPPEGGVVNRYTFPPSPGWPPNYRVKYQYPAFSQIRDYLAYRKQRAEGAGAQKLPVTINFGDKVPVQMIVNMLDICQELKITDFAINAQGYD